MFFFWFHRRFSTIKRISAEISIGGKSSTSVDVSHAIDVRSNVEHEISVRTFIDNEKCFSGSSCSEQFLSDGFRTEIRHERHHRVFGKLFQVRTNFSFRWISIDFFHSTVKWSLIFGKKTILVDQCMIRLFRFVCSDSIDFRWIFITRTNSFRFVFLCLDWIRYFLNNWCRWMIEILRNSRRLQRWNLIFNRVPATQSSIFNWFFRLFIMSISIDQVCSNEIFKFTLDFWLKQNWFSSNGLTFLISLS